MESAWSAVISFSNLIGVTRLTLRTTLKNALSTSLDLTSKTTRNTLPSISMPMHAGGADYLE